MSSFFLQLSCFWSIDTRFRPYFGLLLAITTNPLNVLLTLITRTSGFSTAITIHKKHRAAELVFIKFNPANALFEKCPYSEIFCSVFYHTRTEYASPNAGKNESEKLRIWTIFTLIGYSHLLETSWHNNNKLVVLWENLCQPGILKFSQKCLRWSSF